MEKSETFSIGSDLVYTGENIKLTGKDVQNNHMTVITFSETSVYDAVFESLNGETITKVVLENVVLENEDIWQNVKLSSGTRSYDPLAEVFTVDDVNATKLKIEQVNDRGFGFMKATIYFDDPNAVDVTATETSAEFLMPLGNVSFSYSLVRDMSQGITLSGVPAEPMIVKVDAEGKYHFAEGDIKLSAFDELNGNAELQFSPADLANSDMNVAVERKGENGQFAAYTDYENPQPGTYRFKVDGLNNYEGTLYSDEFTFIERYDLSFAAADEYFLPTKP